MTKICCVMQGPHLLAPTGSDLSRYGAKGTVFAGYHYDLNFLTIHGRSRFPGLHIWLKDGRKVAVSVPPGCLLLQAGKEVMFRFFPARLQDLAKDRADGRPPAQFLSMF